MALQLNTFAKVSTMLTLLNLYGTGSSMSLKIYPSSVALPTLPPTSGGAPAGFLINFTNFTTAKVNNQFKLSVAPASTNAVATGTPNWFFFTNASGAMIGDSIGLSGSSPLVTLSSLSITSGSPYSLLDMTLTMV